MGLLYLFFAIPAFILFAWSARRLLGVTKLSMTRTVISALIGFEAFGSRKTKPVRTGSRNPIGTAQQGFANAKRSAQIARIATKHGLGKGFGLALSSTISDEEAQNYGIRLREAFEEAGGVFVKLGQLLATRPDIIPQATADELTLLHQDVEPAPRDEVEAAVERDLRIAIDLASFAEERISEAEQLGVTGLAEQFARQLQDFLSFRALA
jgi:predicted unusual protein kinase regulating ubiquinone biosynthesis (AarF/ABC1/UbiB family)